MTIAEQLLQKEEQEIKFLSEGCAYVKYKPITKADQMTKPLSWKPMDKDWKNNLQSKFWATNFTGSLEQEFEPHKLSHIQMLLELRDRLLTFGGEEVCLPASEQDLQDIMKRGQFWYGDRIVFMEGLPSQCHFNSAHLWNENRDNPNATLHLATGYALSDDGMWRQHSWLVLERNDMNKIVETTEPRLAYFGFIFTVSEAEEFYEANSH